MSVPDEWDVERGRDGERSELAATGLDALLL